MTSQAVAVDWSAVEMTAAAQNTKAPDRRINVVVVPRKALDRYWHLPWSDVEAAGAAGKYKLSRLVIMAADAPKSDTAFLRGGQSDDGNLRGLSLLFRQGWD